ncbi:MAG TPA: Vms1/Ankzf1 family peptidyl-tRNA hydrolase [Solirubrobacteraceae bacterium]
MANEITVPALRGLALARADSRCVVSAYLNLDPQQFATAPARASAITSLLDEARREVEGGEHEHEELVHLRGDVERIAGYLQNADFAGARAMSVFACAKLDLFEALALPHAVENTVIIDYAPFIAPLVEIGPPGQWCVALVNRRSTRILRGSAHNLAEVVAFGDEVHGQHSQGGRSQARYERSVERDVDEHLRRTARVLLTHYRRRHFESLLLAAPVELRQRLIDALHPYVRDRMRACLDLDIENTSVEQVREAAAERIGEIETARTSERLERLRGELGASGRAVAGSEGVLQALNERRVEALLYEPGLKLEGAMCALCSLLQTTSGVCPVDETPLIEREDMLEEALQSAVGQSAELIAVDGPDLGPLGGIAALLRF